MSRTSAPLQLDYLSDGRDIRIGIAALMAGLSVMLFAVWAYQLGSEEISRQEMLFARVNSSSAIHRDETGEGKDNEQVAAEIKQANEIILELNLPWKELFGAFEAVKKGDIAVLSIEPDAKKGLVRIGGEAKSLESLPAYIAYLQKVPLFREVVLLHHQIQEQDPQKPVRFMLQASWSLQR